MYNSRVSSVVVRFPRDALEYGQAGSNNNTEGCGAVSSFVYQNSLDICAGVPLLLPQFKHNTVHIRINFIGIITGITQPVRFNV